MLLLTNHISLLPINNFVIHDRMLLLTTHTYTPNPTTSAPLQLPDTDTVFLFVILSLLLCTTDKFWYLDNL